MMISYTIINNFHYDKYTNHYRRVTNLVCDNKDDLMFLVCNLGTFNIQ